MAWISPTGASGTNWTDPSNAKDNNTGTRAYSTSEVDYLELTHSAIYCSKVRIYASDYFRGIEGTADLDIDVYYGGGWHNIWSGAIAHLTWVEKTIGSTQLVTAARVKFNQNRTHRVYEFDFWEAPPVAPTVTTQAVNDILPTTATGNVTITDKGGENCSKRGICWNTSPNPTVANDKSEETDSFGTGSFERPMTGLLPSTHYYAKGYAYNSAGYGYGNQVEFDTSAVAEHEKSAFFKMFW